MADLPRTTGGSTFWRLYHLHSAQCPLMNNRLVLNKYELVLHAAMYLQLEPCLCHVPAGPTISCH